MKIEHFAINVADPVAVAAWYHENCGLRIARKMDKPPYTHFLADSSDAVMVEIYNNPPELVPDYAAENSLTLHLAFVSENPHADRAKLEKAGARFEEEVRTEDGSLLVMLRDPWGFPIQLCRRAVPMI